jgi:2-iminobutanoate/2-iminopropanoate deaminase
MANDDRAWQPVTLGAGFPPPKGAYSPGVRAGDLLFVSGQVPRDPRTGEDVGGDVVAQSRRALDNLRLVVEAAGGTLDDVVSVTVYLAHDDDWEAFNGVYRDTFRPPYPARAVVGAGLRGMLVEVSAVARLRIPEVPAS